MKRHWHPRRPGHPFIPPELVRGSDDSFFCKERHEWVHKDEICAHCDKFRKWDGVNLDCKYRWEWRKTVEENLAVDSADPNNIGWRVEPDDPDSDARSEYGEILDRWFEEEQKMGEEGEEQEEDLELGSNYIPDEVEGEQDSEAPKTKMKQIVKMLKRIDDDIYPEIEEDEEEEDDDEF